MAQEQSLQLRLRILAREENFIIAFAAFLISYIILGWFSPFDAKLVSTRTFSSFIRLIFNVTYSASLAAVASAIFTFDARVLGIPDIEKLNVTPLAVAGSGLVSALFLFQAILGGSSALAWFFCSPSLLPWLLLARVSTVGHSRLVATTVKSRVLPTKKHNRMELDSFLITPPIQ
jgi:hypothetical protein